MSRSYTLIQSAVAAAVPTFILLNLTGMTAFHGLDATLLVSGVVAASAFVAQGVRSVADTLYHTHASV